MKLFRNLLILAVAACTLVPSVHAEPAKRRTTLPKTRFVHQPMKSRSAKKGYHKRDLPQPGEMDPTIGGDSGSSGGNGTNGSSGTNGAGQMEQHWRVFTDDDARAIVNDNARWFVYESQFNQDGSVYAVRYACITNAYSCSYDQSGNVNQIAVDFVVYDWSWPGQLP